jgi:hypothetical protein
MNGKFAVADIKSCTNKADLRIKDNDSILSAVSF